jgi:hypothetical protein
MSSGQCSLPKHDADRCTISQWPQADIVIPEQKSPDDFLMRSPDFSYAQAVFCWLGRSKRKDCLTVRLPSGIAGFCRRQGLPSDPDTVDEV